MSSLRLVTAPDPLLNEISKPVDKVDYNLRNFMKDMVKTMYNEHGIGLAAVQVGKLIRVLVMDLDYQIDEETCGDRSCCDVEVKNTNPRYFINPEILEFSKETNSFDEGCLSFPGARSKITRPKKVKVKYLNFNGEEKVEEMDEIMSTCIQHEIDHLNGITFVDHISRLKREMILKKMRKLKK